MNFCEFVRIRLADTARDFIEEFFARKKILLLRSLQEANFLRNALCLMARIFNLHQNDFAAQNVKETRHFFKSRFSIFSSLFREILSFRDFGIFAKKAYLIARLLM